MSETRPLPPGTALSGLHAGTRLEVTPDSGRAYVMTFEEVRRDTLLGYTSERNVRQPLARVRDVQIRDRSEGNTMALVLIGVAALATLDLVLYAIQGP